MAAENKVVIWVVRPARESVLRNVKPLESPSTSVVTVREPDVLLKRIRSNPDERGIVLLSGYSAGEIRECQDIIGQLSPLILETQASVYFVTVTEDEVQKREPELIRETVSDQLIIETSSERCWTEKIREIVNFVRQSFEGQQDLSNEVTVPSTTDAAHSSLGTAVETPSSELQVILDLTRAMLYGKDPEAAQIKLLTELKTAALASRADLWKVLPPKRAIRAAAQYLVLSTSLEADSSAPQDLVDRFWECWIAERRAEITQQTLSGTCRCLIPIISRKTPDRKIIVGFLGFERSAGKGGTELSAEELSRLKRLTRDAALVLQA